MQRYTMNCHYLGPETQQFSKIDYFLNDQVHMLNFFSGGTHLDTFATFSFAFEPFFDDGNIL